MNSFDKRKLTEMVLYILNKTDGLDLYHVFKVLYFANIDHLAKCGLRITTDDFCALPDGPVPSILYDSTKEKDGLHCDAELEQLMDEAIVKGNNDASYMWAAKRQANLDYISLSEIEVLDKSIASNAHLPYNALKLKSHGDEWHRAFYSTEPGRKIMRVPAMAKDAQATDDMVEYIKEELEVEAVLA